MTDPFHEIPELEQRGEPERDGIAEEDNPVPLWFNVGFYGLMAVGILYIAYYLGSGWSQVGQYRAEVERVEASLAAYRESQPTSNPYLGDAAAIAEGRETFDTICAVCHKADGSGLVGPSLVDPYWKYGDDDESLFASVAEGRPLGMPPWGAQLGSEKIWKALAYVASLPKSDVPGVGAPDHQPGAAATP